MDNKEKAANRRLRVIIAAIVLVCTTVIAVFLLGCIRDYDKYDEDNLHFVHEKLTFEKYEQRHSRSGWYLIFHFKEYEEPFPLFTVTSRAVNKVNLGSLTENDILEVAFCEEFDDICEISCNGVMILSVSDYAKANQNNQIIGIAGCFFAFLCGSFLAWIFIRGIDPNTDNQGLGKIRIEYVVKGNVIRIYHTRHVCSLVINGQIFDQHHGVYGSNFCLKGIIGMMKAGGRTIRVEAKMGVFHMYLYCNDQLVAKKFMAFG